MGKDDKAVHMRYRIETERADLFDTSIVITMVVRINADVPFDRFEQSFARACSLHEVLNTRVEIEPSGEAYYVSCDAPHSSFGETELSLNELVIDNERRRFLIEEGEFIRGFKSPDGLVFMMHHLGGDGKSLLYFIETFMRCLNGEKCAPVPFRDLTLDNLPKESRLSLVYGLLLKIWNGKWRKEKRIFGFEDMDGAYQAFWQKHKSVVGVRRYGHEELDALMSKARNAGVTLTSYLIADMVRDMDVKVDVGLAVDGRTDGNRSMGNQATGISLQYRYNKQMSLEDNARKIQRLMKHKLADKKRMYLVLHFMGKLDPSLVDALNLEHAGYFTSGSSASVAEYLGYGSRSKDLSITNLTRADIPLEYGRFKIDELVFVPPVVSYGKNIIGIVTAGSVMNVTTHYLSRD